MNLHDVTSDMESIRRQFDQDFYAKHSGIELLSVEPGKSIARMPVQRFHLNGLGGVQGGAIFTLADFAFAAAANSHGTVAVAVNVSITFMKGTKSGVLTAEARELSCNPKLGTYTVEVRDEQQHLIAVFQGLAYRKNEPFVKPAASAG